MRTQESPLQRHAAHFAPPSSSAPAVQEGAGIEGKDAAQRREVQAAADGSPQVQRLKAIQQAANQSPQVQQAAQLQTAANPTAQLKEAPVRTPVIQRFADTGHAGEEGRRFRAVSMAEFDLTDEVNGLLREFQERPTAGRYENMMDSVEELRLRIKDQHRTLVEIFDEYEDSPQDQQAAFFNAYLEDKGGPFGGNPQNEEDGDLDFDQIRGMFDALVAKTVPENEDLQAERSRFLMFVLQGLHDSMGVDQYRNLNRNLGDGRQIRVGVHSKDGLSGGLAEKDDEKYALKQDNGGAEFDEALFEQGGGTGVGFLNQKFALPYDRVPNDERGNIGDVQLNMDLDDELMPFFAGVDDGQMRMFTAPKKFAVHHEVGHLNSMLEGVSGGRRKMTGELRNLSDQEEMYNIWGGPRSDRAYGQELGLPQRFGHQTGGNHFGPGSLSYKAYMSAMKDGLAFTHHLQDITMMVSVELRRLLGSYWGKVTPGIWFTPDGVAEMREIVKETGDEAVDLGAIQQVAHLHLQMEGGNRHRFTQFFYNLLDRLEPGNKNALVDTYQFLKQMVVPQE